MKNPNHQEIEGLRPEIKMGIRVAEFVFESFGEEMVITWTTGGKHMEGSLHPKRRAFDCEPPRLSIGAIAEVIRRILGLEYDVVIEPTCLHVEWDPK